MSAPCYSNSSQTSASTSCTTWTSAATAEKTYVYQTASDGTVVARPTTKTFAVVGAERIGDTHIQKHDSAPRLGSGDAADLHTCSVRSRAVHARAGLCRVCVVPVCSQRRSPILGHLCRANHIWVHLIGQVRIVDVAERYALCQWQGFKCSFHEWPLGVVRGVVRNAYAG